MKKLILFLTLLISISIFAGNDIDTQRFKPSLGLHGMIVTDTTDMLEKHDFAIFLYLHYDKAPFIFHRKDDSTVNIVDNVIYSDILFSFAILKNLEFGLDLPLSIYTTGDSEIEGKKLKNFTIGDIRLGLRFSFLKEKMVSMGVKLDGYFPTGGDFNTSGGFNLQPSLITDLKFGDYQLAFNLGYTFKSNDYKGLSIEMSDEIFYNIGNKFKINNDLSLLLELYGAFQVSRPFAHKIETPLELLLGANYFIGNFKLTPAVALGLVSGLGTPLYRVILGVGYVPRKDMDNDWDKDGILNDVDKCPRKAEDKDDFEDIDGCPDPDNDQDGILDGDDSCPNKPEDIDEFEDKDGCPDLDNDQDGILDTDDSCPNEPEDKDDFEDENGCPDPDNDQDGVLDADDKCPLVPEDKDDFEDLDGCPDPDNDQDGILDIKDQCPNKPENYNGNKDKDGCPDKGKALVQVDIKTNKIRIMKKVYFRTASHKIMKKSYKLLNIVANTLKAYPGIKKVRVEGHTDDRGRDSYNKALSDRRAKSVMKYLIKKGIDPARLIYKGYGEESPRIEVKHLIRKVKSRKFSRRDRRAFKSELKKARSSNRRVEFTIIEENE